MIQLKRFTAILLFLLMVISGSAQNKEISNGLIFDGEPFITINPSNSNHIVVAWMGFVLNQRITIKTTVSFDGGDTWSVPTFLPHVNSNFGSADPSLGFNADGDLFICYIDFSRVIDSGAVYVRKSTDGGLTWGSPVEVINMHEDPNKLAIDRPWMVIDRSNQASRNNIYVTTMNAEGAIAPFNPYFMRSTDNGVSFSTPRYLDTTGWLAGSLVAQPMPTPAVSSNGIFHAVYPSYVPSQSLFARMIDVSSTDGGSTFNYETVISGAAGFSDTLAKKGYLLRIDPTDPDHLAFFSLYSETGDADVYMVESKDGGKNWSGLKRINDDPEGNDRMQDMVWADFDEDGDLIVTWRDRRNGNGSEYGVPYEIWAAVRKKDSSNFSTNFRISDLQIPFDSVLNESGNDFMCVQLVDDTLSAVWGDTRNGDLSIWFQRMSIDGQPIFIKEISRTKLPSVLIYPNPSNGLMTVESSNLLDRIEVYDFTGKLVAEYNMLNALNSTIDLSELKDGSYLIKVYAEGVSSKTVVLSRK